MTPDAQALLDCLLRHPTASAALEAWCSAGHPGRLEAEVQEDRPMDGAPPAPLVGPARYRRVTLGWAGVTVSRAENWYLPQRLPEGVAQRLLDSRVPFGVLLDPFAPQRRIIAAGESADHLLEVRAALALDGTDVALVIERYDRALLAFRAPSS